MSTVEKDWSEVAIASHRVLRSFDEFIQPILARERLTDLGVVNVLFMLNIGDTSKRVVDIVRENRYVGSNASYAISALVDNGLAERSPDPADKRVRVVSLTERGRRLAQESCAPRQQR